MNQELYKHLENETTENLFYNFKHDGLLNFEKKIISGKILHKRKYSSAKLKTEKSLIENEILSLIRKYSNKTNLESRKRKEVYKSIFRTILGAIASVLLLFISKDPNEELSDWVIYFAIAFILILILLSTINYNKKVQKLIQKDLRDLELQKQRLEIINKEWNFNKNV